MHLWIENMYLYDKTAGLVGYTVVFIAEYPFIMQSGSISRLS